MKYFFKIIKVGLIAFLYEAKFVNAGKNDLPKEQSKLFLKIFQLLCVVFLLGVFACTSKADLSKTLTTKSFNYPVLKGKVNNPVLRIRYENLENEDQIKSILIHSGRTDLKNIKSVRIFYTGQDSTFNNKIQFGETVPPSKKMKIEGMQKIEAGANYFWVSYELTENADLQNTVSASLMSIEFENKKLIPARNTGANNLRLGVAVRQHNDDNVHTYRIPGLVTTNKGTLLAIYDVRREGGRDLQGDIDIGLSRSIDGGNSWEPMQIVLDRGEWGGLPQKFNGVSDANILVDKNTGDIYIAGLWMFGVINKDGIWEEGLTEVSRNWNHQWRNKGSQPGLGVKQTSQFLITKSTDDGKTWSEPINLTTMCKDPKWWLWAPAPGHGITLTDGTLVFPTQGRDENGLPFSNITFSKDGGITWNTSNAAAQNTTESMAVELSDGSIMLNMRDNRNRLEKGEKNGRAIFVTKNLGETWTKHPTSHSSLIECVCMASIHKHYYSDETGNRKSLLFFSNPNSKFKRHKQTIKASFDDGLTWPKKYWMELDEGVGAGYSCLTTIDENTIGVIYEGSQAHMTFQTIKLDEFLKRK